MRAFIRWQLSLTNWHKLQKELRDLLLLVSQANTYLSTYTVLGTSDHHEYSHPIFHH